MQTTVETPRNTQVRCCPPFDPEGWTGREVTWTDHLFVKERVHSLFHVPLDFGRAITRARERIDAAHAGPAQQLILSDETSPWGADLYVDVTRAVPGATMAPLSGRFVTRVYEGPFKDAGRWAEDMARFVEGLGHRMEKLYFAYTTCPDCAKAYGHNYVILFARIGDAAS